MSELYSSYLSFKEFRDIKNFGKQDISYWIKPENLELAAVQIFAKRYVNPITRQNRILLKLGTGVGKTLTSLLIAINFIKVYYTIMQKLELMYFVSIVGFSKPVFRRELLKFPELNIITYEEIHKLAKLKQMQKTVPEHLRADVYQEYSSFRNNITKRITNAGTGGMYAFYGYKELFNDLFVSTLKEDINSSNIMQRYRAGEITVNKILLKKFANSLVICDEIHMVYNTVSINNYGLAIQFILDYYAEDIYALFLTATMINNDKRELIDSANLIRTPGTDTFKSSDFFTDKSEIATTPENKKLWEKRLQPIYEQFRGKVIFLEESGADYPTLFMHGQKYDESKLYKHLPRDYTPISIPYINFDIAKMSPLHEQTYQLEELYENTTSHFTILDMVFPNPAFSAADHENFHPSSSRPTSALSKRDPTMRGLFHNDTTRSTIAAAPQEWRNKIGIHIKTEKSLQYYTGSFLQYENLQIYSAKYCLMLDLIRKSLEANPHTKFIIYHPYVVGSGILTIGEILHQNGFVPMNEIGGKTTYSAEEFITQAEWVKKYPNREFIPARYFVLHSDITEAQKSNILDEFNSYDNRYGRYIKFFIGSKKIKQSIDFKDVTTMFIMSRPDNIPEWIQIKGRFIRKNALANLHGENKATLHTVISTGEKPNAIEPRKYARKVRQFDDIREIEYHINRYAVNNYINYADTGFKPIDDLGAFPFEVPRECKLAPASDVSDISFYGYGYYQEVLEDITKQIKRAFVSVSVWTYDSLFKFISRDGFSNAFRIENNKALFNIALKNMIYNKNSFIENKSISLFNSENTLINRSYVSGVNYQCDNKVIVQYGKYYILVLVDSSGNIEISRDIFLKDIHTKESEKYIIATDSEKTVLEINYKRLKADLQAEKNLEAYAYKSLLKWPAKVQYVFMKFHIEGKITLPKEISSLYTKLRLMGADWYEDDINRHTYKSESWSEKLKIEDVREENDIVIGIIANEKFKIRNPLSSEVTDARLAERGTTCYTTNKDRVLEIAKKLNIIDKTDKLKSVCYRIFTKLVDLEIKARASSGKIRYLYLFNE